MMKVTSAMGLTLARAVRAVVVVCVVSSASAAFAQIVWAPEIISGATKLSDGGGDTPCAIADGVLKCWGHNFNGELGDGSKIVRHVPTAVLGAGVSAIANGDTHHCVVINGAVQCWGRNYYGALGTGDLNDSLTPTPMPSIPSGATDVSAGSGFSCAIVNGAVECWGRNLDGQLGIGSTYEWSPLAVQPIASGASAIVSGDAHTCAIVDGAAQCWGFNGSGQIGGGQGNALSARTIIPAGVTALAAGAHHTCALVGGAVQCWGWNGYGQLGDGTLTNQYAPVTVISAGATDIKAGNATTCAAVNDSIACWGLFGQKQILTPQVVRAPAVPFGVAGGAVRLLVDGAVLCDNQNYRCHQMSTILIFMPSTLDIGVARSATLYAVNNTLGSPGNPHPIIMASATPATCTVSGTTITPIAPGLCRITADQAGDDVYQPALTASYDATVLAPPLIAQTITFSMPSTVRINEALALTASASSGLAVTFNTTTPSNCQVSAAGLLSPVAVGPCAVVVTQSGDARYSAAPMVTGNTTVQALSQAIDFTMPSSMLVGTPATLRASASSGLTVSLASATPATCSIAGSTLTPLAAGVCTVVASQAGNASYAAAAPVTRSASVYAAQAISFNLPATVQLGVALTLNASASSGLAVSYASATPATCALNGATLQALAAGACSVLASQAGNDSYAAAVSVARTTTVLAGQTINFSLPATLTVGTPVSLNGAASSGLAVNYASTTPTVCTVSASTLTPLAPGLCSVVASQGGNATYAPAQSVAASANVVQAIHVVVDFIANPVITGQAATATASISGSGPGGTVTFSVDGAKVCDAVPVLPNGATCKLNKYPTGQHVVSAVYVNGAASASGSAILTVLKK